MYAIRSSYAVIALSSYASADLMERGREVGFHNYVAKFDREGLILAAARAPGFNIDILRKALRDSSYNFV